MQSSSDRILTTHVGSLPRPPALAEAIIAKDKGRLSAEGQKKLPDEIRAAVSETVRLQVAAGVDVVNDGEASKIGYATYVRERLTGFAGTAVANLMIGDLVDTPELAARTLEGLDPSTPSCTGPIAYVGAESLAEDLANLSAATAKAGVAEAFMTAASPGVIAIYLANEHYPSREAYLNALADAMRSEYEAIADSGMILQIDCPDLAMGRHIGEGIMAIKDFRKVVAERVELINHATRNIPSERMRLHLCWGNYIAPHHHDVPLHDILDLVLKARPQALLFEAANPRHEHEWRLFDEAKLPDDKIIIPGVIDTCTNYVEHPELVADRIERYANAVGRDRVIAGTDCGFASFASFLSIDPKIAWMKLESLSQGAAIASKRLWATQPIRAEVVA